jgi:hypothetical protein
MSNASPKLRLVTSVAAMFLLAVSGGCKGFFVNQPNSVSVTTQSGASTFAVPPNAQLKATASFDSGDKDVTNSANWQSSSACASVSTTGLVTGVGTASSVTVTATVAGVSGSITGSVNSGSGTQTLTITSSPQGPTFTNGTTAQFFAALNGTDVTSSTTWVSSDTTIATFSSNTASFVGTGSATITASSAAGTSCASGSTSITVQ